MTVIVTRKTTDDELYHWKYIKKVKKNGKWRYYYDMDELKDDLGYDELERVNIYKEMLDKADLRKRVAKSNLGDLDDIPKRTLTQNIKFYSEKASTYSRAKKTYAKAEQRYEKSLKEFYKTPLGRVTKMAEVGRTIVNTLFG